MPSTCPHRWKLSDQSILVRIFGPLWVYKYMARTHTHTRGRTHTHTHHWALPLESAKYSKTSNSIFFIYLFVCFDFFFFFKNICLNIGYLFDIYTGSIRLWIASAWKTSTHQTVEACVDLGVLVAHLMRSGKSSPQAVLTNSNLA